MFLAPSSCALLSIFEESINTESSKSEGCVLFLSFGEVGMRRRLWLFLPTGRRG